MPDKMLSIIIPIYNEETVVAQALPPVFKLPIKKEVIVINDGSDDRTAAILTGLQDAYSFRLINQPTNQGKGAAVKRGLADISGDYFIICDADAEYDPGDIPSLLARAEQQAGERCAIYGSRFLNRPAFSFHYLVNRFLTSLTNWLYGSRLTDMETCFKLIPAAALKEIRLSGGRFEIEPEITAQLLKAGYAIYELPIAYRRRSYAEGKKIRARDGLLAIKTLLKEKLRP